MYKFLFIKRLSKTDKLILFLRQVNAQFSKNQTFFSQKKPCAGMVMLWMERFSPVIRSI